MTSTTNKPGNKTKPEDQAFAQTPGKAPYTFRATWALVLLAVNFLVAAIYLHVINP